ncbi:MAG: type II toxin-antitoxin system antitoxin SocA domain-containing protein [Candidatus Thiodiazotropha sp.]
MKLIKLVYIAHGWHLANFNSGLIGEAVEAWKYGPVIPSLYHSFKQYKNSKITQQKLLFGDSGNLIIPTAPPELTQFLDAVWDNYSRYSGIDLSAITHQQDTPWYKIWHDNGGSNMSGAIIPTDLIKQHYRERLASG